MLVSFLILEIMDVTIRSCQYDNYNKIQNIPHIDTKHAVSMSGIGSD